MKQKIIPCLAMEATVPTKARQVAFSICIALVIGYYLANFTVQAPKAFGVTPRACFASLEILTSGF